MSELILREPGGSEAVQLAALLCEDQGLRKDLGLPAQERPTGEGFLQKLRDWCRQRQATTFAMVVGGRAIGTISLSHRSQDGVTAQIGYWIGTNHRRQGFGARAFAAVLCRAAAEGIGSVSATIEVENMASRRIWERHGATSVPVAGNRLRYELRVKSEQLVAGEG